MGKTPEGEGFIHDHSKELVVGSLVVGGLFAGAMALARQRLKEQAHNEVTPVDEEPDPTDNS